AQINNVEISYNKVKSESQKWKTFIPCLIFYGIHNQYHLWMFGNGGSLENKGSYYSRGALFGDFGISYRDRQPVIGRVKDKFFYSFFLSFLSVIIAFAISIPAGIYAAYRKDSLFDKASSLLFFMLYSIPSFFAGLLLLLLF